MNSYIYTSVLISYLLYLLIGTLYTSIFFAKFKIETKFRSKQVPELGKLKKKIQNFDPCYLHRSYTYKNC